MKIKLKDLIMIDEQKQKEFKTLTYETDIKERWDNQEVELNEKV